MNSLSNAFQTFTLRIKTKNKQCNKYQTISFPVNKRNIAAEQSIAWKHAAQKISNYFNPPAVGYMFQISQKNI